MSGLDPAPSPSGSAFHGRRQGRRSTCRRQLRLPARAVGLRQDHAAAHDRRARGADRRRASCSTAQDITPVPTHRRDIGMVFQSLALFPHLSVGENIAYPLRIRGAPRGRAGARGRRAARAGASCRGFADRPVAQLSGGQRQRVAIARALALSTRAVPARRAAVGARRQAARGACRSSCASCSSASASPPSSSPTTSARP